MATIPFLFVVLLSLLSITKLDASPLGNGNTLPDGHPNRCFHLLEGNKELYRLEALPGTGWDNLRNKDLNTVFQHTYNKCKTTADGRFLIPDSVTTIPVKSSGVDTVAEFFEHWDSYTSLSARSVNFDIGVVGLPIGGKFSAEYESIKTKQQFERSVTTRMQLRYLKYVARIENEYNLHPSFKSRLQKIANA